MIWTELAAAALKACITKMRDVARSLPAGASQTDLNTTADYAEAVLDQRKQSDDTAVRS